MSTTFNVETRMSPSAVAELRVEGATDGAARLSGYAARFNEPSVNLGGFVEQIAPGAFDAVLKTADVRCLVNHDPNQIIGRTKARTLTLGADKRGLRFTADLPDTQVGRDLAAAVRRGDIDGCSFSFTVGYDGDEWSHDLTVRTVRRVKELYDVGPVVFPAYPSTSVSVTSSGRSIGEPSRIVPGGLDIGEEVELLLARQRFIEGLERGVYDSSHAQRLIAAMPASAGKSFERYFKARAARLAADPKMADCLRRLRLAQQRC